MDWSFEVGSGEDLAKTIQDGLNDQAIGSEGSQDLKLELASLFKDKGEDGALSVYDFDQYGSGGEYTDPNGPPGDPENPPEPPPPPPSVWSDEPTGPLFDYSTLFTLDELVAWMEWLDSGPSSGGDGDDGYDSLEEYMHGAWNFDIDPELIDFGAAGTGFNYNNAYQNAGQFGAVSVFGTQGPGGLIPMFREWSEAIPNTWLENGETINGFTVAYHREFLGFQTSRTWQVASLNELDGGIQDWWARGDLGLDALDLAAAYNTLWEAMQAAPNTTAIGTPYETMAGDLAAPVVLNGVFIGTVVVTDEGYGLYDRNNNLLSRETFLPHQWGLDAAILNESLAHQERVTGIPFANGLVQFATLGLSAGLSFLQGLGFGWASGVLGGQNAHNATAGARLMEAAYELRIWQLRRGS
ncbi:MAG: hypothetical protein K2Y04_06950 [Caulobacteraceae bacterium]|nr:hypothetical protein [Caulobacteraceae bacterium]